MIPTKYDNSKEGTHTHIEEFNMTKKNSMFNLFINLSDARGFRRIE